jgi:hypothetical protein
MNKYLLIGIIVSIVVILAIVIYAMKGTTQVSSPTPVLIPAQKTVLAESSTTTPIPVIPQKNMVGAKIGYLASGNDVSIVNNISQEDCSTECNKNILCNAWTYNKNDKSCFLKGERVPKQVFGGEPWVSNYMEDIKKDPSKDFVAESVGYLGNGNDIRTYNNISKDDCKLYCGGFDSCQGWSYNNTDKSCFLKDKNVVKKVFGGEPWVSSFLEDIKKEPTKKMSPVKTGYLAGGNDVKNYQGISDADCRLYCGGNDSCFGWTYNKNDKSCFLKNDKSPKSVFGGEPWISSYHD